jgi:hypothetical protein
MQAGTIAIDQAGTIIIISFAFCGIGCEIIIRFSNSFILKEIAIKLKAE